MESYTETPKTGPFDLALRRYFVTAGLAGTDTTAHEDVVQAVINNLRVRKEKFNYYRDPRAIFTGAYEKVTEKILEVLKDADRGFKADMWLAALDHRFGQLYLDALDAFDEAAAYEADGNKVAAAAASNRLPEVWKYAFEAIGAGAPAPRLLPNATVMQELLIPLIVHTVHDLPFAVAQVALAEATGSVHMLGISQPDYQNLDKIRRAGNDVRIFQRHVHDYHRINNLLLDRNEDKFHLVDKVQEAVEAYNPLLKALDRLMKNYDELLTYQSLQLIRGMVWHDTTRLLEATSALEFEEISGIIVEKTKSYIREIYEPRSAFRQQLILLSRLISGLTRKWPEATSTPGIEPATSSAGKNESPTRQIVV